jgi:hypothetical protein
LDEMEKVRHGVPTVLGFCVRTRTDPVTGWNLTPFAYKRWPRPYIHTEAPLTKRALTRS